MPQRAISGRTISTSRSGRSARKPAGSVVPRPGRSPEDVEHRHIERAGEWGRGVDGGVQGGRSTRPFSFESFGVLFRGGRTFAPSGKTGARPHTEHRVPVARDWLAHGKPVH